MSKLSSIITSTLGLASKTDLDLLRKQNQELETKIKQGIAAQDRPMQRGGMLIGQSIPPDMKTAEYLKAYKGWTFACVRVLAEEVADIKLTLKRRLDQTEFENVDNHPVLDLLYKVNPLYTSYLMWEATEAYMELAGETFWWLVGPKNNPKEIWTLRPDWVQVVDSKDKLIMGYKYGPPGDKKIMIPFEQMIHFKDFNPTNVFRGHGTVKASAKAIDTDEFAAEYNRTFFYNSAIPGGALETEQQLDDDQREKLREEWEKTHQGKAKSWRVAILEAGLKWQDIGMNRKEMDFTEGRRTTRDEILAMFRVPKPILTFDDVNRAAAKEARAILLENVISHKMKRMVSFLNEFLLPRYGDDSLFFDFVDPVPNDMLAEMTYYKTALGGMPWMTQNEVREEQELQPIEGGDSLMVPFSMAPAGSITPEQKALQRKNRANKFNVRIPTYPYTKAVIDKTVKKIEETAYRLLTSILSKKKKDLNKLSTDSGDNSGTPEETPAPEEIREARWRSMIKRTDPREVQYIHTINGLFNSQQERVNREIEVELQRAMKDKGDQTGRVKATVGDVADLVLRDTDVFSDTLMSYIRTVIEAEGIQQIQSLVQGKVFFMQAKEIQKFLKKDGVKYIKAINEETAEQIKEALSLGVEAQESIPQLKARIEAVYDDARGFRAERIARSEVLRATNFATNQAYKQSGVVEAKEWLTAHDERVCPWCGPMDGKTLGLDEDFAKKGDVITGTNENGKKVRLTIGVGNIDTPPLHPNCRCTLIPKLISVSDDKAQKPVQTKELLTNLVSATMDEVKRSLNN